MNNNGIAKHYQTRLGLCQPGEFNHKTVTAIVDLLCMEMHIDQQSAFAFAFTNLERRK